MKIFALELFIFFLPVQIANVSSAPTSFDNGNGYIVALVDSACQIKSNRLIGYHGGNIAWKELEFSENGNATFKIVRSYVF